MAKRGNPASFAPMGGSGGAGGTRVPPAALTLVPARGGAAVVELGIWS